MKRIRREEGVADDRARRESAYEDMRIATTPRRERMVVSSTCSIIEDMMKGYKLNNQLA